MESQFLVTSEIILSIYSRGAQRGKGICPESHSRTQIESQDSTPSPVLTSPHLTSHCLQALSALRYLNLPLPSCSPSPEGYQGVMEGPCGGKPGLESCFNGSLPAPARPPSPEYGGDASSFPVPRSGWLHPAETAQTMGQGEGWGDRGQPTG